MNLLRYAPVLVFVFSLPFSSTLLGQTFWGLDFSGNSQYVDFGTATNLGSSTFSVETWFKWTGSGNSASTGSGGVQAIPLVAKCVGEFDGDNRDGNYFLGIRTPDGVLAADFEEGATGTQPGLNHPVAGVTAVTPNVWHHAAVTYDGASWALYLDGALETTLLVGQPPRWDSIQHAALATTVNSGGAPSGYFAGTLDEVRIWNYARSASQISSNMARTISSAPGLLGRWSLDETSGSVANDSSGNGTIGTLFNGPIWSAGYTFATAPSVTLTNPIDGATFIAPAVINLAANTSDPDGSVVKVEFFADNTKLGETTSPPFAFSWNASIAGYYALRAVATDNSALVSTSAPVNILIQNPIVQMTSPTNGSHFIAPDPVSLTANASDSGGTITLVEFFDGPVKLGEATSRPFTFTWNSTTGAHALAAVSTAAGGIKNTSAPVNIVVASNVLPFVAITSPADNAVQLQGAVTITATASDSDDAVARVEFFSGANSIGQSTNAPFTITWTNSVLGNYSLTAVATDRRGGSSTSAVVHISIVTNTPPAVAITSPADNSLFPAPLSLTIAVNASDIDDPVAKVELYSNGSLLGQKLASPYTFGQTNLAAGTYVFKAVATDKGGLSTTSAPVTVTVINDALPTVSITSPANNSSFAGGSSIAITATANDSDGSVTNLELYAGATLLASFAQGPYNYTWPNVPQGSYALTAVAADNAGLRATSAPVNINVSRLAIPLGVKYTFNTPPPTTDWTTYSIAGAGSALLSADQLDGAVASLGISAINQPLGTDTAYNNRATAFWNSAPPSVATRPTGNSATLLMAALVNNTAGVVPALKITCTMANFSVVPEEINGLRAYFSLTGAANSWTLIPELSMNSVGALTATLNLGAWPSGGLMYIVWADDNGNGVTDGAWIWTDFLAEVAGGQFVAITSPGNNARVVLPTNLVITASAAGFTNGVTNLAFYADGIHLADATTSPYNYAWTTVTPGVYTLLAVASDNAGLSVTSSPVRITVQSNLPPSIAINSPVNNAVFTAPASIPLTVLATDSDGGVTNVQFYASGASIGQSTVAPFDFTWLNVPVGAYDLTAIATDDHGARGTSSVVRVFSIVASAPTISSFVPGAGVVSNLTQVTVSFTEPVDGADASDLLINNLPATAVTGANATYTFSFPQPPEGVVALTWSANHGIANRQVPPIAFNGTGANETAQYTLQDNVRPVIAAINPLPGTTVRTLTRVEITFSEPVRGVDAGDLLINNVPASLVSGSSAGPYVFRFAQPSTGTVSVAWASGHGITDLTLASNSFVGGAFSYVLQTNAVFAEKVLISEIMFHSSSERTNDEWIEIYNTDTAPMNLTGWRLKKAVDFAFPSMSLPGRSFLVIAADVAAFRASYPGVSNVIGNWNGQLANHGATIRLVTAEGETVNEVSYAEEGDWATRYLGPLDNGYRGWFWDCPAAGFGKSFELVNPNMPNQYGQNWKSSIAANGTPGRTNSVAATNIPPLILELAHFPLIPRSSDSVVISARVLDERANGLNVRLFYRDASTTTPGAFSSVQMFDDGGHNDGIAGDNVYAATIAPQANNTVIEFYVQAVDLDGNTNTYPRPVRDQNGISGQFANALYQVDDTVYTANQPLYKFIMTESERQNLDNIARNSPQSNAEMNNTFIAIDGTGIEYRYNCGIRERGNGTRGRYPANQRINVPSDRRWKGLREFNINTQFTESQYAGYLLTTRSGLDTEWARIVRVRLNNLDLANAGSPQFGCYIHVEAPDSDMASAHFPLDGNGNIYRCVSPGHQAGLAYLGTSPGSYASAGYEKVSNVSENDYSDLINMINILNNAPDSNYTAAVRQVINVENWMLYFAVNALLENEETSLGNGVGDDYGMYRGVSDPRFVLICHDWDTVLGEGDTGGNISSPIFRATQLPAVNRFMKWPLFAPIYYATLKRLTETTFAPANLGRTLDEGLNPPGPVPFVPQSVVNSMKAFASNRVNFVVSQIPLTLTVTHSLSTSNGYLYSASPVISLRGQGNAVDTRAVLVNGAVSAWSVWEARWTNNSVALQPGINNILIQAIGTNGVELTNLTMTVWYDNGAGSGTTVGGIINGSVNWLAANGPYRLTSNLTLENGATLTIQAGATVFVSQGVTITVNGTGKILAQGTPFSRVRFTKSPVTGNWGSLDFIGTTTESRLSYVDFDSCGGTGIGGHDAQIHVNNSIVYIDHCTWASSPPVQYMSFDNSSFIVQNCVFPTYPQPIVNPQNGQPEMLHGVNGIPAGGYGIFRDNYFGHTWGFNDTIDFTGGNRPGPILQIINNVFDGAGDDCLDLDNTDAWIEGNIFMHVHRDPARTDQALDTASAISGGADFVGQNSDWTIINNFFYDVDHVFLNKGNSTTTPDGGGRVSFLFNTVAHVAKEYSGSSTAEIAAFDWSDDNVILPAPSVGSGLYAAYNIFYDIAALQRFYDPANHTVILDRNILPASFKGTSNEWAGAGSGNLYVDPKLNLGALAGIAPTNVTPALLRQAFQLLPDSPALAAGFGGRNIGSLNTNGVIVTGEPAGTTPSTRANLTLGPVGTFNWGSTTPQPWGWTAFKWNLDRGLWSAEIPITNNPPSFPTITLSNLSNGPHTVYVTAKNDAGHYQDDSLVYPATAGIPGNITVSRTWIVNPNSSPIRLNEILASNQAAVDHQETHPDVIELKNLTDTAVDLGGLRLTDDLADPDKFTFPLGTTITQNGYLVVYANTPDGTSGLHTGFNLSKNGASLYLYDTVGRGGALLDSVTFGLQMTDYSIGVLADGAWGLCSPTFGAENISVRSGDPKRLLINEWLTSESLSSADDFVELYNPGSLPVQLSGLYLTENPLHWPNESRIAALSFIGAKDYVELKADGNVESGANHLNFSLQSERGLIGLMNADLTLIDCVIYGPQTTDVSQGLNPNGSSNTAFFTFASPGGPNPTLVITNQGVVINELLANNSSIREPDGSAPDWVEFFNQSTNAVDMSDMSFTDTAALPRRFVFPPGSLVPGRGFKRLRCDTSIPVGPTNAGFTINASGGAVFLFDKVANGGGLLSSITFGLQATDFSIGRVPDGTGNWTITLPTPNSANIPAAVAVAGSVKINEWMAAPDSGEDWFELWNPNPQPVAISGFFLTDDLNNRIKSPIPLLSFLGASTNGYQRFWADNLPSAGANHTTFKLNNGGESIGFANPSGLLIDAISFTAQQLGVSEGRFPDGTGNIARFPGTDSPGESNYRPLTNVVINEALTHADPPLEDAIELRNLTGSDIDLSGWFLSDSKLKLAKYRIPNGTILPANGFKVFYEYQFNDTNSGPSAFALSAGKGDDIFLSAGNSNGVLTGFRAHVKFGPAENAVSFGRYITSDGREECVAMSARSLGQDEPETLAQFRTGAGLANPYPRVGPVIISQLMYHPLDNGTNDNTLDEFIELRNILPEPVSLYDPANSTNTWHIRDAVDYDFPQAVSMPPNSTLLIVSFDPINNPGQLALFRGHYGLDGTVPVYGPYIGKLKNADAKVELWKPDLPDLTLVPYVLVERVHYFDFAPWPSGADGTGACLQRVSQTGYGNDATNWVAATPSFVVADSDGDGLPDWWENANGLNPLDATGVNGANGDPDGDGFTNLQEYQAGTDPRDAQSNLRLRIISIGPITLQFVTQPAHSYTIQSAHDVNGPWTRLIDINPSPTPQTIQVQDATASNSTFYRIRTPQLP